MSALAQACCQSPGFGFLPIKEGRQHGQSRSDFPGSNNMTSASKSTTLATELDLHNYKADRVGNFHKVEVQFLTPFPPSKPRNSINSHAIHQLT